MPSRESAYFARAPIPPSVTSAACEDFRALSLTGVIPMLGALHSDLSPAQSPLPREVPGLSPRGLPQCRAYLRGQAAAAGGAYRVASLSRSAPRDRVGSLCKASLRLARAGLKVPGSLYVPGRHLEPATPLAGGMPRRLPLQRLPPLRSDPVMRLPEVEFIRRCLLHVLPKRFVRMRSPLPILALRTQSYSLAAFDTHCLSSPAFVF